jgi:hypothetical protein
VPELAVKLRWMEKPVANTHLTRLTVKILFHHPGWLKQPWQVGRLLGKVGEWRKNKRGEIKSYEPTARCPRCGIDSVIGSASGYPITREFLQTMKSYWF